VELKELDLENFIAFIRIPSLWHNPSKWHSLCSAITAFRQFTAIRQIGKPKVTERGKLTERDVAKFDISHGSNFLLCFQSL
jgi:hypothetical protein